MLQPFHVGISSLVTLKVPRVGTVERLPED